MMEGEAMGEYERGSLLALLYDWHNHYRLKRQNEDVRYFKKWLTFYQSTSLIVVGAGTGRVVKTLASVVSKAVALDKDVHRLKRIQPASISNLQPVVADICTLRTTEQFDLSIVPYSTIQLIPPGEAFLQSIRNIRDSLVTGGKVLIDVSTSFSNRYSQPWQMILEGYCPELDIVISEWQSVVRHQDCIELFYRYYDGSTLLVEEMEIWFFHNHTLLTETIANLGMHVTRCDCGYGSGIADHRRIYHISK